MNRNTRFRPLNLGLTMLALALASSFAAANTYSYVNWQSSTGNGASKTVNGILTLGSQTINVTYDGEVYNSQLNNTGNNYFLPVSTYQGGIVDNAPVTSDLIQINGNENHVNTITFSTPVVDPIIDVVSLGRGSSPTTYQFTGPISIIVQGPGQAYGGGPNNLQVSSGNKLIGSEGDGVVQISGTYTSISWTTTGGEVWNGFNFGAAQAVPEPSELMGLGAAVLGLLGFARRRKI